jgi:signal transduction histidine kinase/CheY-like chemotaxis protein
MEYDEPERRFLVRSVYRTPAEVVERLQGVRIDIDATLVGRAAKERRPIAVSDLSTVDLDPHLRILFDDGWRSLVAVPMLREERIVGSLIVRRKMTGDFSEETLDLLETFASQSALALLNAQLFRALEERSAQLEVAGRHKSEFLASMSHELRTPLNAVLGFSEVLLERMFGDINEKQEEYLRDIHGSGKHLLELLNEILDLSKVEAGQMELEFTLVDVRAVLEYAASMLRERAAAHAIALQVEVDDRVGEVEVDELRFRQVVLNLVSNAVKFTPDGGAVVVRARVVGAELQVSVEDTGIGIPETDRERIFESFQQGGRGASREEGTGLGLTLSRRIVELLDGRMWLESEVGAGSTFGFAFPVRRRTAPHASQAAPLPGSTSIVVIEDDRRSLDLMTAYLSGAALTVVTARDGQSGLEAVRRDRPSAVLLDIRLPGIDGWEVLRALQEDRQTAPIPVVVVSIVDERARGAALGAAGYLVKPVSRDDLLSTLTAIGLPVSAGEQPGGGEAP